MKSFLPVIIIIALVSCSSPREVTTVSTTTTTTSQAMEPADSVIYYKTELEFDQKDLLPQLLGTWSIQSMQRQNQLPLENLQNVSMNLLNEGKFSANTECGIVSGNYSVKGMSIKFNNLQPSWNTCSSAEQLNEMLRLLQNTVSMYTVKGNEMTLRDNSSNIIFTVRR